jgi:hypothetical protein
MFKNLALATSALTMVAGFAVAQQVQQTTTSSQSVATPGAPDINAQAADAQARARAQTKPGEAYEWSVDSTTTKVPVHPTVVEKTTTTNVAPPAVVNHHTSATTTTTTGGDQ